MSLDYGTFYEVADTGLFLGGGREGSFSIVFKEGKYFVNTLRIDGGCDCIQSVYDAILKFAPYPLISSFLKRYEGTIRKTAEKVWENMKHNYDFPKCYDCTLHSSMKNNEDCWVYDYSSFSNIEGFNEAPVFDKEENYERVEDISPDSYKSNIELNDFHELFFSDCDYIVESISDFFKSNHIDGSVYLNYNGELVLHTGIHSSPSFIDDLAKEKQLALIRYKKTLTFDYINENNEVNFYYYFLELPIECVGE